MLSASPVVRTVVAPGPGLSLAFNAALFSLPLPSSPRHARECSQVSYSRLHRARARKQQQELAPQVSLRRRAAPRLQAALRRPARLLPNPEDGDRSPGSQGLRCLDPFFTDRAFSCLTHMEGAIQGIVELGPGKNTVKAPLSSREQEGPCPMLQAQGDAEHRNTV